MKHRHSAPCQPFVPKKLTRHLSSQNSAARSKSLSAFRSMGSSNQSTIERRMRGCGFTYLPGTLGCPYPTAYSLHIPWMGILKLTASGILPSCSILYCMLLLSLRSTLPFFLVMDVRFLPLVNCKVLRLAALRTIEAHRRACRRNSSAVTMLVSEVSVMVWLGMAIVRILRLPNGRPCQDRHGG